MFVHPRGCINYFVAILTVLAFQASALGSPTGTGVDPQQALQRLIDGNARFAAGASLPPDLSSGRLEELTHGQQPFAVILTCSDSRVAPEHLFNAGMGEVFVIRLAGNIADSDAIASAEYAVAHLGTSLIVVLGHDSCGAVSAALANADDSPAIRELVAQIDPAVSVARRQELTGPALLAKAIELNAVNAADHMLQSSSVLSAASRAGKIKIVVGKYGLDSGKVRWIDTAGLATAPAPATSSPAHAHSGPRESKSHGPPVPPGPSAADKSTL